MDRDNDVAGVSMYNHRLSDIAEEPKRMLLPIEGYEKMPLVTLEETMEPLVDILPDIRPRVYAAKYNSKNPPSGFTVDQSAAIMLYTMGSTSDVKPLYHVLNSTLRSDKPDREDNLKPWFLYLKLFINALSCIPSFRGTIYRGVKLDLSEFYPNERKFVWWGFSSCTKSLDILQSELYLGRKGVGTIFIIECFSGKEIHSYSHYSKEDEVLLVAARQFIVVCRLNPAPQLWIIKIKEIEPPFPFLKVDSSISSTLEVSSLNESNNLTMKDVEITTNDLEYCIKFDKDTMTIQESISDDYIQVKSDTGDLIMNDYQPTRPDSLPPSSILINSSISNESQSIQASIPNPSISNYPSILPSTLDLLTTIASEPDVQIKVLQFKHETITIESAKILAENIRQNKVLEILYFLNNHLEDEGLKHIIEAITGRSLLKLFVIDNKITDVSAQLIAELLSKTPEMMSLLSLDKNLLTAQGVRAIIQAIPRDTTLGLRTLSINGNVRINDECINDIFNLLNENRSLRCLYIEKCNLSDDSKERLQKVISEKTAFSLKF